MKKVLIILAHPRMDISIANKVITDYVKSEPEYRMRDLYSLYPDFKINVQDEQKALLESDIIVFQFPFYWYNMPALLKEWFDVVFEHNFAFGSKGDKLKGKYFLLSITVGGPKDSYSPLGYNHFRVTDYLHPFEQTAYLAQMQYVDPIFEYGMVTLPGYNEASVVEQRALVQARRLVETIDKIKEQ
jgi:putative NADPH-quinone reductase